MTSVGLCAASLLPFRKVPWACMHAPQVRPAADSAQSAHVAGREGRLTDCRSMMNKRPSSWCTNAAWEREQDVSGCKGERCDQPSV